MNITIPSAKKVNVREDELDLAGLPRFLSKVEVLKEYVRDLSREEARNTWAYDKRVAALNYERLRNIGLTSRLTPALLPHEGTQYWYMAPGVFERKSWDYVQSHLRILSGLCGILRPLDGIIPYRLEMQARMMLLPKEEGQKGITSLCEYWGDLLYREPVKEDRTIINLTSKKHSKAIEPYLTSDITYITCAFGSLKHDKQRNAKIGVKATEAKATRGEMVQSMTGNAVEEPDEVKAFDWLGYRYSKVLLGEREYVFLKQ